MTWPMRHASMYDKPFRIRHRPPGEPEPDYGPNLNQQIALQPGETGTVTQYLPASELRFLSVDLQSVFEAGEIEILVGPCADRSQLLFQSIRLCISDSGARSTT